MSSTPATGPTKPLPRGPHRLSREEVAGSQRARLLTAFTQLLADRGYAGVTIGDLAAKAGVSRGAFYGLFDSKEDCLMAGYEQFAAGLLTAMTADVDDETGWEDFIRAALGGYLGTLERDRVAARAFIVEMDAAGGAARQRRRDAIHGFAAMLAGRHAAMRERNPELGELPHTAFLGLAYGVRELVREELETESGRALTDLTPEILAWVTAMIAGAAPPGSQV